jgi:hypothetical protein
LIRPHAKEQETKAARKTYKQPRLEVYGDLRDITRTVGTTSSRDGGQNIFHTRTHP